MERRCAVRNGSDQAKKKQASLGDTPTSNFISDKKSRDKEREQKGVSKEGEKGSLPS